jgi:predicted MFS family arabinose efflux permease
MEQGVMPAIERALAPAFSKGYRAWLLTVLLLMNALNLADRQCMAAVSQAIKVDIRLTDAQLGLIQGLGFAIFYAWLGLPIARLAENFSRTKIVSAAIGLFGVMSSLCSTASGFWQLLTFRIGVGVGDAGLNPPVASLIGDHFKMDRRASAMSIIWLGAPLGVVCGSTLGGWMAEHVSWRAAFVVIGVTGIVVALIAVLTLREPPRGMSDPGGRVAGPPPPMLEVVSFVLSKPSARHILIGCGLAATAMNGIGQFLSQFLVRNFHIGFAETGRLLSLIAGLSMASGLALGGFGVDWATRFDKRWFVWGPGATLLLCAPFFVLGFGQATVPLTVVLLMAAHIFMFVYYTPSLAMAQNMVDASMRASSAFMTALVIGLVGIGVGPTIVGLMSDEYARHAFTLGSYTDMCPKGLPPPGAAANIIAACRDASATGIRNSLMTTALIPLWAAVHYFLAAKTLRRDLEVRYQPPGAAPLAKA